jgi:hypothetical protein
VFFRVLLQIEVFSRKQETFKVRSPTSIQEPESDKQLCKKTPSVLYFWTVSFRKKPSEALSKRILLLPALLECLL